MRRKEKPIARASQDAAWQPEPSWPPATLEAVLHRERLTALARLLRQLPEHEQEVISLKFDAELTNREIAEVLGTSEANVRLAIFRALHRLRHGLKQGII